MVAIPSDWLVGSFTLSTAVNFTVDGNNASVAAGNYYLRHTTGSRSLLAAFSAAVVAAVGGTCTVTIKRNRMVRVVFNVARTLSFVDGIIDGILGLNLSPYGAASTIDADTISTMLFSPGFPAIPQTIRGVDGYKKRLQAVYESDDGTQSISYNFGSETWQELAWRHIVPSRMRIASGAGGGTFHTFFDQCAQLGARFLYYQDITEDDADTANVTWTTQRGPYVLRPEGRDGDWYRRQVPNADVSSPLQLPLHLVSEYP